MMEKLGISNEELLVELKNDYHELKEKEASLIKTGGASDPNIHAAMAAIKAKINELESGNQPE